MWVITPIGFFSIVQKPEDVDEVTLTIRARVRKDLLALKEQYLPGLSSITKSTDTDYLYRAKAPQHEVAAALAMLINDIDYSNFKLEVAQRQSEMREQLYLKVGSVLRNLQLDPTFKNEKPQVDSYGGVVISGGHRILLRKSSNQYAGYGWTFAKTEARPGESPKETAVRAVREKTGYHATIRLDLEQVFQGTGSSTRFYVMDAQHPPASANWQTSALQWASFEEARDLIRNSSAEKGRERDLAILDAVEKSINKIPYKKHPRVQPEDWNDLQPMPARSVTLRLDVRYSAEQMACIKRGFFPTVMEQKWFLYFTGNRLRAHRSWTGLLIYDVGFAFEVSGAASITDVVVNRDSEQYGGTDDEEDLKVLQEIIQFILLEPLEEPEVDGFVKAIAQALEPLYLGSPQVVAVLIDEVLQTTLAVLVKTAQKQALSASISKVKKAFTAKDSAYKKMPGWHSAPQLGSHLRKYILGGNPVSAGASLATIINAALKTIVASVEEVLAEMDTSSPENLQNHIPQVLELYLDYLVTVFLGTNTIYYGEQTLQEIRTGMEFPDGGHHE